VVLKLNLPKESTRAGVDFEGYVYYHINTPLKSIFDPGYEEYKIPINRYKYPIDNRDGKTCWVFNQRTKEFILIINEDNIKWDSSIAQTHGITWDRVYPIIKDKIKVVDNLD